MRLIDADVLKAHFPEPTDWTDPNEVLYHITGIWAQIDATPTVHQWIPVTERLPEGFQTCIVTDELRHRSYEYDYNPDNEFTKMYGWRYNGRKIVAWMPLPETWKGGAV